MTTPPAPPAITIPPDLLPVDGRFGCGPSKVRADAVAALADAAPTFLGTSHRQAPVRAMVGRLRAGIAELFSLPGDWEVLLGNGGTTLLWDALCFGVVDRHSQHLSFGEFSSKFAACAAAAPWLDDPEVIATDPGTHPLPVGRAGVDTYALTHNETSTGVAMPVLRPAGTDAGSLVLVDATSAAGGLRFDPGECDLYYFAPQKALASDGGLWLAAASPAALERIERLAASDRYIPAGLDLAVARDNSLKDQTYNTPALATVFLAVHQIEWILDNGGLEWAAGRSDTSSGLLYDWATSHPLASPFVADATMRSSVVTTIDLDASVEATQVSAVLRANGVVDTDAYRKLGRNQLRVATFPAIDPEDVAALVACLDYVIGELAT